MTAAEQLANRDRVLDEVVAKMAARGTLSAGMRVIERWARTGREFSLNQIRGELADAGVDVSKGMGGITMRAIGAGLIRKVRDDVSTSPSTNGKRIGVYVGGCAPVPAEIVSVPVRRDRGRFAAGPAAEADGLFDVAEVTR